MKSIIGVKYGYLWWFVVGPANTPGVPNLVHTSKSGREVGNIKMSFKIIDLLSYSMRT